MQAVPVAAGLVLVGFAGHAVLPTIRNDMADKGQYNRSPTAPAIGPKDVKHFS